jgi:threonine/homoserine/homoserine lactone efflux protein
MSSNDQMRPEVKWGVGCLVAASAMVGLVILLMYVAFTFELEVWAQIAVGVGLTFGGGLLSWLVVSALGQSRSKAERPAVSPVPDEPPPTKTSST